MTVARRMDKANPVVRIMLKPIPMVYHLPNLERYVTIVHYAFLFLLRSCWRTNSLTSASPPSTALAETGRELVKKVTKAERLVVHLEMTSKYFQ